MHTRVCNVWKNEEYRVTLPYAKIDIAGIAKHCGQTRVKPCFQWTSQVAWECSLKNNILRWYTPSEAK